MSQWAIHDYYLPSKDINRDQLIAHRAEITADRPALPAQASKAANQLHHISKQRLYARPIQTTGKRTGPRHITARGTRQPEIDVQKLARAFVMLAPTEPGEQVKTAQS